MHQLLLRFQFFGFLALDDGRGVIAGTVIGHPQSELRVKTRGILGQNGTKLLDRPVIRSGAELKYRFVVLFLEGRHTL